MPRRPLTPEEIQRLQAILNDDARPGQPVERIGDVVQDPRLRRDPIVVPAELRHLVNPDRLP